MVDLQVPAQNFGLQPYQFEPLASSSDSNSDSNSEDEQVLNDDTWRLGNTAWCQCKRCIPMTTVEESMCCLEINELNDKMGQLECIGDHSDIHIVCLHYEVLKTALMGRYELRGDGWQDPPSNRYMFR